METLTVHLRLVTPCYKQCRINRGGLIGVLYVVHRGVHERSDTGAFYLRLSPRSAITILLRRDMLTAACTCSAKSLCLVVELGQIRLTTEATEAQFGSDQH